MTPHARSCSTAATAWPARWSGPLLDQLPIEQVADLLDARRRVPRPRAEPAAARRTAASSSSKVLSRGRRARASPGTATPTAASSSTTPASSWTATSSPRCSPSRSCAKEPGRDDPLRRARLAARCATWSRPPAARARSTASGHAFFKTRMREEGAAFGGEVSGHYYFRDFYCADSGTIPALLILELLSAEGQAHERAARAASARSTSSPARSTPRSPTRTAKMSEIEERYSDGEVSRLDGVSVDYDDWHFNVRALEHRAAAAAQPRVARLPGAHGGEARRGAGPDPLVSAAGGHPPARDPDAVRGRARQLLPDRGRAADAGRRRAELGQGARRARARRSPTHGHAIEDIELIVVTHQHIDHLGLVVDPRARSGAEVAAIDLLAPSLEDYAARAEPTTSSPQALMLRNGIPEDVVARAARRSRAAFRAWGSTAR